MFKSSLLFTLTSLSLAYAQVSPPQVVLHEGTITGQTSFLEGGASSTIGELQSGQGNVGDGVYFGGYYWNAFSIYNYNNSGQQQIVLFPITGTDAPDGSTPLPFAVSSMNGNLFVPYNNVRVVAWGDELWVISWDSINGSSLVFYAPLAENTAWSSNQPQAEPFFVTQPDTSSNFIQTDSSDIRNLTAEIVDGELTIFTWNSDGNNGAYSLGVTRNATGSGFGPTHYIALNGSQDYSQLFDTYVYLGSDQYNIPGNTPGQTNVLLVAASNDIGSGQNHNLFIHAIPADELSDLGEIDVSSSESAYLSKTGLFTADPFQAYDLRISDGASDYQSGQLWGMPGVTLAIFGQVPEGPHWPWFIATAPLILTFDPATDNDNIPVWSYSGDGLSPGNGLNFIFSLGVQRVQESNGNVQDYTMFSTMVQDSAYDTSTGYFQAAKANYLVPLSQSQTDTSSPTTQAEAESYAQAWSLIGVIHGPPPVAFNDDPSNQTTLTVAWDTSESATNSVSVKQSNSTTVTFTATGTTPFFQTKLESGQTLLSATGSDKAKEVSISIDTTETINSVGTDGEVSSKGYLLYLMPVFNNQPYATYSFRGNGLGVIAYLTWLSSSKFVPIEYDLENPEAPIQLFSSNISLPLASGMKAMPSLALTAPPESSDNDPLPWTTAPSTSNATVYTAGPIQFNEDTSVGKTNFTYTNSGSGGNSNSASTDNTNKYDLTVGYGTKTALGDWGFHTGINTDTDQSHTYTQTTTTTKTFSEGITFETSPIYVPSPAPDDAVTDVWLTAYLIFPNEAGNGDWIPTANQSEQPFLLTWTASYSGPDSDTLTTAYWGNTYSADGGIDYLYVPFMERWIYNTEFPWAYDFAQKEWRFYSVLNSPQDGMWYYSPTQGWLFSDIYLFPWYYSVNANDWYYDG